MEQFVRESPYKAEISPMLLLDAELIELAWERRQGDLGRKPKFTATILAKELKMEDKLLPVDVDLEGSECHAGFKITIEQL